MFVGCGLSDVDFMHLYSGLLPVHQLTKDPGPLSEKVGDGRAGSKSRCRLGREPPAPYAIERSRDRRVTAVLQSPVW